MVSEFRGTEESMILHRQKPLHDRAILPPSDVRPSSCESPVTAAAAVAFR